MKLPGPQPRNTLERCGLSAAEVLGGIGVMWGISFALGNARIVVLTDLVIAILVGAWVFLRLSPWSAAVAILVAAVEVYGVFSFGRDISIWFVLFAVAFSANKLKPKEDATLQKQPGLPPTQTV
jgi:hypothetical protein